MTRHPITEDCAEDIVACCITYDKFLGNSGKFDKFLKFYRSLRATQ